MTNYEKYFGTEKKVAALILKCGPLAEMFLNEICKYENKETYCLKENKEFDCGDKKFQRCIIKWLKEKAD
jgi:hypothetical protein